MNRIVCTGAQLLCSPIEDCLLMHKVVVVVVVVAAVVFISSAENYLRVHKSFSHQWKIVFGCTSHETHHFFCHR